jgi:crossover junction endodeoxyribonuclease RuvC
MGLHRIQIKTKPETAGLPAFLCACLFLPPKPSPKNTVRILGIDPGLQTTGFGLIDTQGAALTYVASGTISTRHMERGQLPARIKTLFDGISELTLRYRPDAAAVEIVFVNVNPQSTLLLGQARGACLAALTARELPVAEYTALQMKQAVAGHGKAAKAQVQEMVRRLLHLPGLPGPDAADALGLAITHAQVGRSLARLGDAATLARKASGMYRQGRTR